MRNRLPASRGYACNDTALSRGRPERFKPAARYRADQGITIATGVSQWNDISGNARHLTQGTAGLQPTFVASGTPKGRPSVRTDGSDDTMGPVVFTLNQPTTICFVLKTVTLGASGVHDIISDGGILAGAAIGTSTTPNTTMNAGSTVNLSAALANGSYDFAEFEFNGASSVIRVHGANSVTGDAGSGNAGGFTLGSLQNGTRDENIEYAEIVIMARSFSIPERARHDNYRRAWHGV